MKFTKCVIGANYTPIGFVYVSNGVERFEDFASLCRSKVHDDKLFFSESGVFGLFNNATNTIDICRETVGGGYSSPVDPSLTLVQRIISGGKVVGFVVQDSTGTLVKKHIASILSASKYMKPANYKVVERDGNQFLQGKGVRLGSLPSIDLTPGLTTAKKPRTVRTEPQDVVDPKLTKGVSLVNVVDIVRQCRGAIFKMPSDTYSPVGATHTDDGLDFNRLDSACEIAPAVLEVSTKKLSASFNYRVLGSYMTETQGTAMAYIFRKKNIVNVHYEDGVLRGDKVRLDRIGIAIPLSENKKFQDAIVGTVAVTPMENKSAKDTAFKVLQMKDAVLYAIDLKEISVLGPEYEEYLMVGEQIKATLEHIEKHKYISSFLKTMVQEYERRGINLGPAPLWDYYKIFSDATLQEMKAVGIDIKTGAYLDKSPTKSTNKVAVAKTEDVEIVYELETKITPPPKDAAEVVRMELKDLPVQVQKVLAPVLSEIDPVRKLKIAKDLKEKSETAYKRDELTLWKHKLAMLLDGNNALHNHDRGEWTSASVSSRAQFTKYVHPSGVAVKLRQITMSR